MTAPRFRLFRPRLHSQGPFADAKAAAARLHPFARLRAPHHTCPPVSMTGDGHASSRGEYGDAPASQVIRVRPGECTLADGGVLLLDEFPEFKRDTLEAIARIFHRREVRYLVVDPAGTVEVRIPAAFTIFATAQLCPCGMLGKLCRCTAGARDRFTARVASFTDLFQGD